MTLPNRSMAGESTSGPSVGLRGDSVNYRPDVDGLRAIAVAAVIAFHAFPLGVPSGFVGVDVFFVISGFLISSIIFKGLNARTFDLAEFYCRRIRRLFPALILVLAVSLAFGWMVLFSPELKQLAKHAGGSAVFIANFVLWKEKGYFDNAAETKPLLHIWSLGVEEQFYLFWPFAALLIWRFRSHVLSIVIAGMLISFVINVATAARDFNAAFFAPWCRFWELAAGAGLAYI